MLRTAWQICLLLSAWSAAGLDQRSIITVDLSGGSRGHAGVIEERQRLPASEDLKTSVCSPRAERVYFYFDDVERHVTAAKKSGNAEVRSDRFLLGCYAVVLRLLLMDLGGDGLWTGLYMDVCPGPNDRFLQWPFKTPYTLTVHHVDDTAKDLNHTVRRFDTHSGYRLSKPTPKKCRAGHGNPKLFRLQDGIGNYLYDNGMSVSVTLHA